MIQNFTKWDYRFIKLAEEVASWSTCLHHKIGCVIVKDNHILSTGYNGAPKGLTTCKDYGECRKEALGITKGPEYCMAVHAEQNAICAAARFGVNIKNSIAYCTHKPCSICLKMLVNSGITQIIYKHEYDDPFTDRLVDYYRAIELIQIGEENE